MLCFVLFSCGPQESGQTDPKFKAREFLDEYSSTYLDLSYQDSKAEWASNTKIIPGDTSNSFNLRIAKGKLAGFTGNSQTIFRTRKLLEARSLIDDMQVRQLEHVLFMAADKPAIVSDVVAERIRVEAEQTESLYGFNFQINNEVVTTNGIDAILKEESNIEKRLEAWMSSKEVGVRLKPGVARLRDLRNRTVQALGYDDFFSYQVSEYGMTVPEMRVMCEGFITDIWPLYRELHTFARYELAKNYEVETVPDMIPAHWLPNRWGQDWSAIVEVEGIDLDESLKEKGAEWLVKQAESFYVSLGFEPLPQSFYQKSSLYPLPTDAPYKKNNHASAWHMDYQHDVRCLMSVIPNSEWYETTHHELGHIYYYLSYTNPDVPPVLRRGANRAFHEAIGSMLGFAAMQEPFLAHTGLISSDTRADEIQMLLKEALNYIVFIPWSAGVMTIFEHELYADTLAEKRFNQKWWELKKLYQGIEPPQIRGEEDCDPASKTHITDDAAQYYDYALSYILLFQIHKHIAEKVLNQDPHATNYYGRKDVGDFLKSLLETGMTRDWQELIQEATGEPINARAMLEYFEPVKVYLKERNKGRPHTLPKITGG